MRKILVMMLAGLVLVLTGCSNAEGDYLDAVRQNQNAAGVTASVPDSTYLDWGHAVCTALDNGASVDDLISVIVESTDDPTLLTLSGKNVVTAVQYLCPDNMDTLKTWADLHSDYTE
jgi:hypothetical protein